MVNGGRAGYSGMGCEDRGGHNILPYIIDLLGSSQRSLSYSSMVHERCCPNRVVRDGISCPACGTYEIATRFGDVVICPIHMCLTVYEFSFILFDLCLFITIFQFYFELLLIVTFWIFTYHKIWIMLIIYCFILNYWVIHFATCLEVFWSVMS